jgi:hypothetical protein
MNEAQRKFLTQRIDNIYKAESEKLRKKIPSRPSLNNYMIAAFLDGSVKFNDIDILKKKIRDRVLKMGSESQFIESKNKRGYDWDDDDDDAPTHTVMLNAEELFIVPEAYLVALREYEAAKEKVTSALANLSAQHDTVTLKIQVGSSKALDKLVEQVDNLADLTIINSQLTLGSNDQKQLT